MRAERFARAVVMLLAASFAACAPAATTESKSVGRGGRAEEQIASRGDGKAAAADVEGKADTTAGGSSGGPGSDARAVHGTIDPVSGRRTAAPAVDQRLREPRRVEVQAGRVRQVGSEYLPQTGDLPYGYRIQVMAEPDFARASSEAARLNERLGGRYPVYVEFLDPYYKVRVGDFVAQADAQPALAEVRAAGYPDAWAVRTTIQPPS